jgi:hypothetical protein
MTDLNLEIFETANIKNQKELEKFISYYKFFQNELRYIFYTHLCPKEKEKEQGLVTDHNIKQIIDLLFEY